MTTSNGKVRATIAGYVAGLLKLDEREGAEVVETKRNGSGTRVTIEFTDDAADRVLTEFAEIVEAIKNDDNPQKFSRDQLRSIERAGETIRAEWIKLGGVESVGPDGAEYIAPAPTVDAVEAFVMRGIAAQKAVDEIIATVTLPAAEVSMRPAETVFVWHDTEPADPDEYLEAVDRNAERLRRMTDAEDKRPAVDDEPSENVEESSGKWWEADGIPAAVTYRIRTARLSVTASADRLADAEKISPAPKNLAALRAVATRARRQYDVIVQNEYHAHHKAGQPA